MKINPFNRILLFSFIMLLFPLQEGVAKTDSTPIIPVLGNAHKAITFLTQMITLAMQNGGEGQEAQLEALKQQIEALPKPQRGDRKAARLQNDKGLEEFKKGQHEQALQFFLAAYQLDASDVEIVNNVGMAYLKTGNLSEAARYLGGALSLAPNRAAAWGNLAEVFAHDSRLEESVAAYALTYRYSKNKDATRRLLEAQTTNVYDPQVMQTAKAALALPLISGGLKEQAASTPPVASPVQTPTSSPQELQRPEKEAASQQVIPSAAKWVMGNPMVSAHGNTALVTLQDGRLLAVSGNDGVRLTTIAELYEPTTGQWIQTGSTNQGRNAFRPPILLRDGKVLVAAGHDERVVASATAELYDPVIGKWSYTGSLNIPRGYTVLVGLQDGRVLAATGAHGPPDGSRFLSSAELYDPVTGRWTNTASALIRRESASGILLHDGRVLLLGGYSCCDVWLPVTELYDPVTETWSRAGDLPSGRSGAALIVLPDGRVLAAGGASNVSNGPLAQTLLFDPATGQWSYTGNLNFARAGASAVLLSNGKVLLAGGGPLESEIYDPAAGTWSVDASLALVHNGGTMALLPNGDVLMAGGGIGTEGTATEIYSADSSLVSDAGTRTSKQQSSGRPSAAQLSQQEIQSAQPEVMKELQWQRGKDFAGQKDTEFKWHQTRQNCSIWAETKLNPDNIIAIESCMEGKAYGRVVFKSGSFEIGRWKESADYIYVAYFYDGLAVSLVSTVKLPEEQKSKAEREHEEKIKKDQVTCFEHVKAYKPKFHALPDELYPAIYVGELSILSDNELISKFGAKTTIWMRISGGVGNNQSYSKGGLCGEDYRSVVQNNFTGLSELYVSIQNASKFEDVSEAVLERLMRSVFKVTLEKSNTGKLGGATYQGLTFRGVGITDDNLSKTYAKAKVGLQFSGEIFLINFKNYVLEAKAAKLAEEDAERAREVARAREEAERARQEAARQQAQKLEAERRARVKANFEKFLQQTGATELVAAEALQSNPFRFEGTKIAVLAKYQSMLDKNTSIFETRNGVLAVSGLDPKHTMGQGAEVVLAGSVTGTSQVPTPRGSITAPLLSLGGIHICQINGCADILSN